ncbi:MAG: AMP-binding protein [Clostridia bacterium]|nr:AMP-binding protein [Clostridia bacterium]
MREPIHKFDKYNDLKEMLKVSGEKYGERPAYIYKTDVEGKFREITHKEFREQVNALGTALISMGLKDKRIAVISENRYEWGMAYLATVCGTGIVVPLDKSLPDNEIESLINRSEVEAIFYSNKYDEVMNRLNQEGSTGIKFFISMDLEEKEGNVYSQKELVKQGQKLLDEGNK